MDYLFQKINNAKNSYLGKGHSVKQVCQDIPHSFPHAKTFQISKKHLK